MYETNSTNIKIFLCHASNDKPKARILYNMLLQYEGLNVWLDDENLLPGQDWDMEIRNAVGDSDIVIVCLSKDSVTKAGYIQKELRIILDTALEKPEGTIFIIPIRLDGCQIPRKLQLLHYIDFFPRNNMKRAVGKILMSIKQKKMKDGHSNTRSFKKRAKKSQELIIGDMEYVYIPRGKFFMGSTENDSMAYDDEKPNTNLNIGYGFWISKYEVTNAQFSLFVDETTFKGLWGISNWQKKLDHPVVNVSWYDAMMFCNWVKEKYFPKTKKNSEVRLPTEAEWEKAARGTDKRYWPWGTDVDNNKCNFHQKGKKGSTTAVNTFSPVGHSPYGVADMAGNVWEWTLSLYRPYPYRPKDGRENILDEGNRVLRGGAFDLGIQDVRVTCRYESNPNERNSHVGFRVFLRLLR